MIDSFHSSGNSSLFQTEVISLWTSQRIVLPHALINSAGVWSIPGDLWLFSFSIANSNSEAHGSGTSGFNVYYHFTKYVEAFPIPDQTAKTCARIYVTQIVTRHGTGSQLITDQGRSFMSSFFQDTCKILAIRTTRTTSYYPPIKWLHWKVASFVTLRTVSLH